MTRSPLGGMLDRAERLSADSDGKPHKKVHKHAIGYHFMHVKETPPHALSHANTLTSKEQEERAKKEREAQAKFDQLDARDREILRLHLVRTEARDHTMPFPASKRDEMERAGWLFVKQTKNGRVLMVKSFVGQLTYEQIAQQVGVSERTVQRRLSAMDPAMVKFAEMRGWT